jgi:hypothetical protein
MLFYMVGLHAMMYFSLIFACEYIYIYITNMLVLFAPRLTSPSTIVFTFTVGVRPKGITIVFQHILQCIMVNWPPKFSGICSAVGFLLGIPCNYLHFPASPTFVATQALPAFSSPCGIIANLYVTVQTTNWKA